MGPGRLVDPAKLAQAFVSPRQRAVRTFELLFGGQKDSLTVQSEKVSITDRIAEWDYGLYDGWVTKDIRKARKDKGLDREREWDIWKDGCEGGE